MHYADTNTRYMYVQNDEQLENHEFLQLIFNNSYKFMIFFRIFEILKIRILDLICSPMSMLAIFSNFVVRSTQ